MSDTLTTTRAIVTRKPLGEGGWQLEDIKVGQPGPGELLVEMVASGVCHTDLGVGGLPVGATPFIFYPRVLGHEGSGYVRAIGEGVTVAQVGDPVLCSFDSCHECSLCNDKHHSHCLKFIDINFGGPYNKFTSSSDEPLSGAFFGQSSFANLSLVKSNSIVNIRDFKPTKHELQLFAPLGCGVQTGAGTILNAASARVSDVVCVFGLGGVGSSAIMGARIAGCRIVIGIDRVESRLELAKELGCTHVINSSEFAPAGADDGVAASASSPLANKIREIADGLGASLVVDTTGVPVLIETGLAVLRNRGRYCQVGQPPFDYLIKGINAFEFMVAGKQFIGVFEGYCYPPEFVPQMVTWYREGKFPIEKMCKFLPAEDFAKAVEQMHKGETIKPIITW